MKSTEQTMNEIFDKIESYDSIVIFGHMNPDGDCVGSVMGMKKVLISLFPDKKVYALGSHPRYLPSFIEPSDVVDDQVISESLALMVDLSDLNRVEDSRISTAKEIVCFDHHIASKDRYPFLNYRDEEAPSATFVLTQCLLKRYGFVPKTAAIYFFLGLVTDTGRFQFDCEPETLRIAGYLISLGVDYKAIYNELYSQSSIGLRYRAFIYSSFEFEGKVTYCVVHKEDYQKIGLTSNDASGKTGLIALLDHHPMWIFFVEQEDSTVRVEFRGDGSYNMQEVATNFGGGGHFSASGCRLPNFDKVKEVLAYCNQMKAVK